MRRDDDISPYSGPCADGPIKGKLLAARRKTYPMFGFHQVPARPIGEYRWNDTARYWQWFPTEGR